MSPWVTCIVLILTVGGVFLLAASLDEDLELPMWTRWTGLSVALTAWLWVPWIAFGVSAMWDANIAKINDLSRPEQVEPPTPRVRPSKADLVESP